MHAIDLRTQGSIDPWGIECSDVILSYRLASDTAGDIQTGYRIQAASSLSRLAAGECDLWDSGFVASERCFGIRYGAPLASRQVVFWRVQVWDKQGMPSHWSAPARFEVGLTDAADWAGCWIGEGDVADHVRSPYFAAEFEAEAIHSMVAARAYISGLGMFYASVNGEPLADTRFDPGESDATRTVYYVTYDILPLLKEGTNAIGLQLGNGQYTGFTLDPVMQQPDGSPSPHGRYQKNDSCHLKAGLCGAKKALVQIEALYRNGERRVLLVSDEHWRMHASPVIFQNWYGGEDHDATLEVAGWNMPGTDRSTWQHVHRVQAPSGRLTAREFPPIVVCETLQARSVVKLGEGHYLVDMGANGAGVPVLSLKHTDASMRGQWITMKPAEMIDEATGGVDQRSCTQSLSQALGCVVQDAYRICGSGQEHFEPMFCYHGFQYLEVSGFPGEATVENFAMKRLRAGNEKCGTFRTSNEAVDQICAMTDRSIESNMFFSFTDCPQIEKLGWIETSHLMFRSLAAGYDVNAWMKKILRDIRDAQLDKQFGDITDSEDSGFVPAIIPEFYRIRGLYWDLNWNGACVFTPWEHYQWYGDTSVLAQCYPVMTRYLRYLATRETGGLIDPQFAQMGEWGEYGEHTPVILVENCAYYRMLRIASQTAALLGKTEDAANYAHKADRVRQAFHAHPDCYCPESGVYGTGSQASYGCALFSQIVPEHDTVAVVDRLVQTIADNGHHLTSGEVGLKQVFSALAAHGRNDVVWKMVMNETPPSYRYFVDRGMTTLPEYWNCDEPWFGMVRSRNHAMMGHVREWLSCSLLGIRQLAPAWQAVAIEPFIPEGMTHAEGSVHTPYGLLSVRWSLDAEKQLHICIQTPPGIRVSCSIAGDVTILQRA